MWEQISSRTGVTRIARRQQLWPKVTIAAAVTAIVFGAGLFYIRDTKKTQETEFAYQNDIAPAKQGAVLTLSNGKKIQLAGIKNGQLANQNGIIVTKSADGQLIYQVSALTEAGDKNNHTNTLSTAKGETYQLRLPDGSLVWLNATSSLTYAVNLLDHGSRRVKLQGEGYFEIAKDKQHPFIVESYNQKVEVLGTHFNINSYQDEVATKTTLLEGSLRVTHANSNSKSALLKPGQTSVVLRNADLKVEAADLRNAMAWKNGFFRFDQLTIDQVMNQLARWYDIDIVYQGLMPDERFNGAIARHKNISEVLTMLSYSKAVKFKIEGRRVTVMR